MSETNFVIMRIYMKIYIIIGLFFPVFFFSQSLYNQEIENRINLLKDTKESNKSEEEQTISICKSLYYMSKEVGNKRGMLIALSNLARIYDNRRNADECLKLTAEGLSLAIELKDYSKYAFLLNIKADVLYTIGSYADSRTCFSNALKSVNLVKDRDSIHFLKTGIYNSLSYYSLALNNIYHYKNYKDSMLYFSKKSYHESLRISEKFPLRDMIVGYSALSLGNTYINLGYPYNQKYPKYYFDIAEKLLVNASDKRLLAMLYSTKGYTEFHYGDKNTALIFYNKALELSNNFYSSDFTLQIYSFLKDYYKKEDNVKMELHYLEKINKLKDSIYNINQNALITQNNLELKKYQNTNYTWIIILIIIILLFILLYLKYTAIKKHSSKQQLLKTNTDENNIGDERIIRLLEMIKNNDKQFLITFQQEYSDLYQKLLKFPQLTSADIELCAYLKLNIQTKEIAIYKKVSIGSVDNRKYRIRKKLNLPAETDLYKWINTI